MARPSLLHRARRPIGVALFLVAEAACATTRPAQFGSDPPATSSPMLLIENHGFTDVHVYALAGNSRRVRLGRVNALETLHVCLPASLSGARILRLEAVPTILGDPYTSEQVLIEAGTEVVWRLENELTLSKLSIGWRRQLECAGAARGRQGPQR